MVHLNRYTRKKKCCGNPDTDTEFSLVPDPPKRLALGANPCAGAKVKLDNINCTLAQFEQSGVDVTANDGTLDAKTRVPITDDYITTTLCPVNVHWHLGSEHRMAGQYDETGTSHSGNQSKKKDRRLAEYVQERYGFACKFYDSSDVTHTTEYEWKHCVNMHVGETYEIHWPHSALGDCGGAYQFQTPFYDGVFCNWKPGGYSLNRSVDEKADKVINAQELANSVGVQAQVFFYCQR